MKTYWAAEATERVGKEIWDRIEQYYDAIKTEGYYHILQRSYNAYYGLTSQASAAGKLFVSSAVTRGGIQGETYDHKVNMFRNVLQHMLVLVTSERPAYETMASNTDYKSQSQAELGDGLLEYYVTEKRSDRILVDACETGIVMASGHVSLTWDTSKGRAYAVNPDTGRQIFEGDIELDSHTPLDVGFDAGVTDVKKAPWKWRRIWKNKWDLIAEMPELADVIYGIETRQNELESWCFSNKLAGEESDQIAVFDWYHERSPAIERGRNVQILPGGHVIFDGPLQYSCIPIFTLMPAKMKDTPYGYTPAFDMLSVQEGLDIIYSSMLTNAATFGTSNIGVPKGHDLRVQSLAGGLNLIEFDPTLGPPEVLNFSGFPPVLFELANLYESSLEKLGGLNSIVRGDPEGALKGSSGAAMALLASQAIQFSYGLQREYEFLHEDVGTAMLKTLQQYADTKRVAMIVGKSNRAYQKEFTGKDIENVDRVVVKRASAISKTTSGKVTIAQDLLQGGMIKNPEEYINVLKTGSLDPMTEQPRAKFLNIRRENEMMRDGIEVPAIVTDNHIDHISEHLTILDDPDARADPMIVNLVLAHIEEHRGLWASADPNLLAATGQQPAPMPMAPGMQQPGMPQPGTQGPAPTPQGNPQAPMVAKTGAERLAEEQPRMPNMPELPQQAPPQAQNAYEQIREEPA